MNIYLKSDLTVKDLIGTLSCIELELNSEEINTLNIILSSGNFINVSVVAVLANWVNYIKKKRYSLEIFVDINNDCGFNDYIARMNFFDIIDVPYKENFVRHNEDGRFLPINLLEKYDAKLIDKLTLIFKNVLSLASDNPILYMLDYSLNEIIENIDRHAETFSDSAIVSQYYKNKNRLEVTILDNGIGIPNALRKTDSYKDWNDEECLFNSVKKAIRTEGIENEGQGNGLYILKRFINSVDGELNIYSGSSCYVYNSFNKKEETFSHSGFWQGTIISFVINTNKTISINEVMEDDNYEAFSPALDGLFD